MQEDEALKIANDYVRANNVAVGDLEKIFLMPAKNRPDTNVKGDLWRIYFKFPLPPGVFQDPDVIVIHVEDSTGEASEFDAM